MSTIIENKVGRNISIVSGIPDDWNKSVYNKKNEALSAFKNLVNDIDSKYLIISYNNEGFISLEEMQTMLSKYGELTTKEIEYVAFRGGRNLKNRNIHTTEYVFILKKYAIGSKYNTVPTQENRINGLSGDFNETCDVQHIVGNDLMRNNMLF